MNKSVQVLLLFLTVFMSAFAAASDLQQILPAAADPIMVLDGQFKEKCYQQAKWYPLTNPAEENLQKTVFTVMKTDNGLWFAFKAVDREIVFNRKENDGALWADDCVEIFLMPEYAVPEDPNTREFYHFIFNTGNFRYDAKSFGGVSDKNWNSRWKTCVKKHSEGFDAEVFIPYAGITFHKGEKHWRFNVGREDRLGKKTVLSQLGRGQTFNDCNAFIPLIDAAPDQKRYNVTQIHRTIRVAGGTAGVHPVLEYLFMTMPERDMVCSVFAWDKDKKLIAVVHNETQSDKAGQLSFRINLPSKVKNECILEVQLADNQGTVYADTFREYINVSALRFRWLNPVYRSTLFASQPNRDISFELVVQDGKSRKITAELCDSSGKAAISSSREFSDSHIFTFPAAKLPYGNYTLKISDGKSQICEKLVLLGPQAGNEVCLLRDGKLIVNGKKFFPRGFIGGGRNLTPFIESKCNVIHFYELHRQDISAIRELLDICHKAGLKVIMTPAYKTNIGFWGIKRGNNYRQKFTDEEIKNLEYMVSNLKSHPALLAWYLYDEPRGADWERELKKLYNILQRIDPAHPVVGLDNAVSNIIDKRDHCDIALMDIYPNPFVSSGPARPVSMIAASSSNVVKALPPGKVLWQCTQAYDNDSFQKPDFIRERRAPTYSETRATVFGCIAAGANGLIPYKIGNPQCQYFIRHGNAGVFADPELKIGYLEGIMPELANLEKVLLAEDIEVKFSGKLYLRAFKYGQHRFIIAANVETVPAKLTLYLEKAGFLRVLGEKRSIKPISPGKFQDEFAPLAVHIYTDSPDYPEPIDIGALKEKIAQVRQTALNNLPADVKNKQVRKK